MTGYRFGVIACSLVGLTMVGLGLDVLIQAAIAGDAGLFLFAVLFAALGLGLIASGRRG